MIGFGSISHIGEPEGGSSIGRWCTYLDERQRERKKWAVLSVLTNAVRATVQQGAKHRFRSPKDAHDRHSDFVAAFDGRRVPLPAIFYFFSIIHLVPF